jgi:hypothetical protein
MLRVGSKMTRNKNNTHDEALKDSKVDAIAAIALIIITVMVAVHWVSNQ